MAKPPDHHQAKIPNPFPVDLGAKTAELQSAGLLEVEMAEANVSKEEAEVAFWKVRIGRCRIIAPFSGRVSERQVHEHEYLSEGNPVIRIVGDQNLELELIVSSRWRKWMVPGLVFSIHVDETDKDYPAEVLWPGAEINPVSQSFKVVGRMRGQHSDLVPGMSGSVTFPNR